MRIVTGLLAAGLLLAPIAGCSSKSPGPAAPGDCPTDPVPVAVSVDQWGDIVGQLGGSCATVTTLLAGSGVDPHDFEPSPADAAKVGGARLVIVNGGHYDEWATKLAASSAPLAPVVSAVGLSGGGQDANPHVWYDPQVVVKVADEVTKRLTALAPDAADYFAARRATFTESLGPYRHAIATIGERAKSRGYAATEPVFDEMAAALGLVDRTPAGFAAAAARETDPAPADQAAFLTLLADHGVDVLIYNTQTEGAVPQQIRSAADAASIPVVEVTETVAPGSTSFQDWQMNQLTALAGALGVTR